MQTQPLEISDFSFGITDYFIDGGPAEAETLDNLVINSNKKPQTRWGSEVIDTQLPVGTSRVNRIMHLGDTQLAFQGKRAFILDGSWTELVGPASGFFFPLLGGIDSQIIETEWRGHLLLTNSEYSSPQKMFLDVSLNPTVRNAGLPVIPVGTAISLAGTGSTYLYAFCFKYTYVVDGATFLDRGPVQYYSTAVVGTTISGGNPTSITGIPAALSSVENWDSANIKIEIYRTVNAGDVYYLVDEISLGTTTYSDDTLDSELILNEQIYVTGGISSNDTPPKAKFVHVVNDFAYYGATEEDAYVVYQSKAADVDSVPANFAQRAEQKIRGISSTFDKPMVLCDRYIYRIDGVIGDDGSGDMILRRIDDKAGCVSAQSIVQTHAGLFWAGQEGFYWTDGFRVSPISDHLNRSYKIWTSTDVRKSRIQGRYDQSNQRVMWTVVFDDASEPDELLVLDLKFPFLPGGGKPGGSFSTWSGSTFAPTTIDYLNGDLYRGDSKGYVLKHSDSAFTDPVINPAIAVNLWQEQTIIHTYRSCFLDFGTKFYRKLVPRILVSAANTTNLSLAINSSNDNNRVVGDLKPIRYRSNITWGDTLPYWSDPSARWNYQGLIEEWRRFPAGGLRCNYKQIELTNAFVQIVNSDVLGPATVNVGAKTAALASPRQWLPDGVGYFIAFEHDNYTNYFEITSLTPTTIVYSDAAGDGPTVNGQYKFILKGYPKGEYLNLLGYVIHWTMISKSHTPFSSGSLGGSPS